MISAYQYNLSGEYVGETVAYGGLLPANTTSTPPVFADGFWPVWQNNAWVNVEDNRQTPYWIDGDTYETPARYMTTLGPLPDGALLVQPEKPEPTIEEAKATKTTELDAEATSRITSGFWYADVTVFDGNLHFSFGTEDQINFSDTMTGASLALTADSSLADMLPSSVTWNGYEDEAHANLVTVTFTASQFLAFWSYAQRSHKQVILDIVRALKAEVVAAETLEEIYAVSWPVEENSDESTDTATSNEGE